MHRHWRSLLLGLIAVGVGLLAEGASGISRRPNLVLILTDDQRYDTLHAAGNRLIRTPNLDRLSEDGVTFRNSFVPTPICCVSRASLLTGQYERRHGIRDFNTPLSSDQWAQTYPALLRRAGYWTGFIGKFGVGDAKAIAARGSDFDFWRGRPGQAGEWFIEPGDPEQRHATARMGNEALEFLDRAPAGQPFCLSISFNAPHARDGKAREFQPDRRDEALYADLRIPMAASATEEDFLRLPDFVRRSEARRRWERRFATEAMSQETLRDYYRLITGIDREVGRLMERLEETGRAQNTVIVFTSDNGWFAGEHGLADKWFIYEESIRVPLIVWDPRLPRRCRGRTRDEMVLNLDVAPTLLGLAGVAVPDRMQGRSLEPLLCGRAPRDWRREFFFEHHFGPDLIPPSEGVRTERWSYVRWLPPHPPVEELYDLRRDPLQRVNRAARPEQARQLETLRARSLEWAETLQ
jgi:arylsulfatase A-like enzyme